MASPGYMKQWRDGLDQQVKSNELSQVTRKDLESRINTSHHTQNEQVLVRFCTGPVQQDLVADFLSIAQRGRGA